jgi:AcrR family transcriptional regulator
VVLDEGAGQASLKRIAREAGITEAQAHNCFGKRIDMLLALTRRELDAVERARRDVIERGRDYVTAVVLSTMSYLDEAELRGPLLQALLMVPEVREALREERQANRTKANEPVLLRMRRRYNFSDDEALCSNAILSAICLRTGGMLATRRITRPVANRLCLSMVLAGMRSNAALAERAAS